MKGKKLLALVALLAGSAIVGTTFAAWAVTDNADPFGIKISPGSIASDTTEFVTLSYGERTYGNVENLAIGETQLAAKVNVIADTSEGHSYTGHFDLELTQETVKEAGKKLLRDYLTVDVYRVQTGEESVDKTEPTVNLHKVGHIPPAANTYTLSVNLTVTDNTPTPVYVYVSLSDTVNASILEEIKSDIVYLQMDWNRSGTNEVTTTKIYCNYGAAGKDLYAYAWTDAKVNKEFPGVKMVDEGLGLYSYELSYDYSNLLFVEYKNNAEVAKSDDLTVTTTIRESTPCYNFSTKAWGEVPQLEDLSTFGYYLVGSFNDWKDKLAYGMAEYADTEEDHYEGRKYYSITNVSLKAGDTLKVHKLEGDGWLSNSSTWKDCGFTLDNDGNIVISETGMYTINCYPTNETEATPNANPVSLVKLP